MKRPRGQPAARQDSDFSISRIAPDQPLSSTIPRTNVTLQSNLKSRKDAGLLSICFWELTANSLYLNRFSALSVQRSSCLRDIPGQHSRFE
jgi:hypothetical protein